MADKKISQLSVAGSLVGTELLAIVQGGSTVQTTLNNITSLVNLSGYVPFTGAGSNLDLNGKVLKNFFISKTADATAKFVFDVSALSTATTRTLTVRDLTGTIALTSDLSSYQPLDSDLTSWALITRASGFDTFVTTPSSSNLASLVTDETGSGALVFGTSPTLTTPTIAQINGVTNSLTINAATTLLDEMYLGTTASRGIWSWNATTMIIKSGSSAANFTIGTPAYATNIVLYNATGNVAIGGVADNATDQLQVSNHIGVPTLNLRGRSGAAPTVINFYPFDATNSIINFRNTSGTVRGFIDLNISSGEMKFWGSTGGYFPTFGSNGSERMRIDINGNVVVNTAAISTSATNGFLYIPSCAGTPTGVPTSFTGRTPMVYDTTNNKFYIYNGGWKSVTLA